MSVKGAIVEILVIIRMFSAKIQIIINISFATLHFLAESNREK